MRVMHGCGCSMYVCMYSDGGIVGDQGMNGGINRGLNMELGMWSLGGEMHTL